MVETIDGKTTKWHTQNTSSWASAEDQDHFAQMRNNSKVIIMGSKTYLAAQDEIHANPDRLRIIMTKTPQQFNNATIAQQLEFTNDEPVTLVKNLEKRGYTSALLVGGSQINKAFFEAGLVHEIFLTIEPKIFGSGNPPIAESEINVELKLISSTQLNEQGTLLLHYKVYF